MEIQITNRNVSLTDEQMQDVERRVQHSLEKFSSQISVARVTLTDVDGPSEGTDVLCRLKITLKNEGEILAGDTDVSIDAVVTNVAERGARLIARRLSQTHETPQQPKSEDE